METRVTSYIRINAKHAKNITSTPINIQQPKISLPPGEQITPELMEMISTMHQKITDDGIKTVREHPSSTTFQIDLPDGVHVINSMPPRITNISSNPPIKSIDVVTTKPDIPSGVNNNPHGLFYASSKKDEKKQISDQVVNRENPCTRLRNMCVIL